MYYYFVYPQSTKLKSSLGNSFKGDRAFQVKLEFRKVGF